MNDVTRNLEHLISRFLDDECTADQRRELNATVRRDPTAQVLFEEYRALDREVGQTLRRAMGRSLTLHPARAFWSGAHRVIAVAAAACLAVMVWIGPRSGSAPRDRARRAGQSSGWLNYPPAWRDALWQEHPASAQPHVRQRSAQRDWIAVPADRPGEFLLLEVDRVRTCVVPIQQDF